MLCLLENSLKKCVAMKGVDPAARSVLAGVLCPVLGSLLTWGFLEPPRGMEMVHLEEKCLPDPEYPAKRSETKTNVNGFARCLEDRDKATG